MNIKTAGLSGNAENTFSIRVKSNCSC